MAVKMTYDEARPLIKNGDIVHMWAAPVSKWRSWRDLLFPLVSWFTGSPIYHNVIAVWMKQPDGTDRLMCVETTLYEGKSIQPLSFYAKRKMEVQHLPEYASFEKMEPSLMGGIGTAGYSYFDFLMIGAREFFGAPPKDYPGQVCSELCSEAWIQAGVPLIDTLISPGKLRGDIEKIGIPVSIVTEPEYNHALD